MNAEKGQQAIRRMKELSGILKEASRAYYAEDREIMSNLEYDALYDELVNWKKRHRWSWQEVLRLQWDMRRWMNCRKRHMKVRCFLWIKQKTGKCYEDS